MSPPSHGGRRRSGVLADRTAGQSAHARRVTGEAGWRSTARQSPAIEIRPLIGPPSWAIVGAARPSPAGSTRSRAEKTIGAAEFIAAGVSPLGSLAVERLASVRQGARRTDARRPREGRFAA